VCVLLFRLKSIVGLVTTRTPTIFALRFFAFVAALFFTVLLGFDPHLWSATQKTKAPAQAEALYAQGMQALQHGDLSAAETAFEKVLRLAPGSAEAHNSLGWVLLAQGKIAPAIREFQTAVKLQP